MNEKEAVDWLCSMLSAQMYVNVQDGKPCGVTIRIKSNDGKKFLVNYPAELMHYGKTFIEAVVGVQEKMKRHGYSE